MTTIFSLAVCCYYLVFNDCPTIYHCFDLLSGIIAFWTRHYTSKNMGPIDSHSKLFPYAMTATVIIPYPRSPPKYGSI